MSIPRTRTGRFHYDFAHRWAVVPLSLLCRPRIYRVDRIPRTGPVIIAANHSSYLDPILVGAFVPRELAYMAKDTLFRGPLGALIRSFNAFPVRRGGADVGALRQALRAVRNGLALLIFPEGTRNEGAELLAIRRGVGFLATRTQAPVVPLYIEGAARVLGRGQRWFRRAQITLFVGEPLRFERGHDPSSAAEEISAALARLRANRAEFALDWPESLG